MRKALITAALSLCLLQVLGCATSLQKTEMDILVRDLNSSSSANREARMRIKQLRTNVIPRLLQETDHPASALRSSKNSLSAMRALRVLRELGAPETLEFCRRLLTEEYFPPTTKYDAALLNEALETVYDQFSATEARDIFVSYVSRDASRYARYIRRSQHWGPAVYIPRVEVDVVRGLRLLIGQKDPRAADALAAFLKHIDTKSLSKTYYHRLAENGFTVTEAATSASRAQLTKLNTKAGQSP